MDICMCTISKHKYVVSSESPITYWMISRSGCWLCERKLLVMLAIEQWTFKYISILLPCFLLSLLHPYSFLDHMTFLIFDPIHWLWLQAALCPVPGALPMIKGCIDEALLWMFNYIIIVFVYIRFSEEYWISGWRGEYFHPDSGWAVFWM